ncbi:hypothetical protein GYMLUDRAFT_950849 [Collybiopsis luxurians FD-317 M1]|nr:hypothetical protein GYMLUDRAFT_950849 [Collybiopsis luxurians FD-317 M1]
MVSSEIELETKLRNDVYLHSVAATLLYYDHILTFNSEFNLLWKRPRTVSTYLFFVNRYFSFFGNICIVLSIFVSSCSCSAWNIFQELFHALVGLIVAILLTLRVYALYDCDKRLLIVLSLLMLIGIGMTVVGLLFIVGL